MFISTRSVCAMALGAALLLGAGELSAQGGGAGRAGGGGRGGAPMTPQAYRVTGIMQQFQANQAALNAARMGQAGAPSHVLGRAIMIQELTKMLPEAFPAGSEGGRALPAIWAQPAEFQARIQAIQSAATGLVEAARGGNAEQIATAVTALGQGCQGCHMAFRGPAPGN